MTKSRSERILRDEAARTRRKELKQIIWGKTARLYSRLRKQRKQKLKKHNFVSYVRRQSKCRTLVLIS
jgi:hypothetical protein